MLRPSIVNQNLLKNAEGILKIKEENANPYILLGRFSFRDIIKNNTWSNATNILMNVFFFLPFFFMIAGHLFLSERLEIKKSLTLSNDF